MKILRNISSGICQQDLLLGKVFKETAYIWGKQSATVQQRNRVMADIIHQLHKHPVYIMSSFCFSSVSYHIFPGNNSHFTGRMICEELHSIPCPLLNNFILHITMHNVTHCLIILSHSSALTLDHGARY
jgi:hypothetical protein